MNVGNYSYTTNFNNMPKFQCVWWRSLPFFAFFYLDEVMILLVYGSIEIAHTYIINSSSICGISEIQHKNILSRSTKLLTKISLS